MSLFVKIFISSSAINVFFYFVNAHASCQFFFVIVTDEKIDR